MDSELEKIVSAGRLPAALAEKIDALSPGTFCVHKSWGGGRIAEWDLLGDRLVIDFEGKPGHSMKLEFAAKSLEPLPPGHIVAKRLADPEALRIEAIETPADLVKQVLESYGNSVSLDELETVLKGTVVPDGKYKAWWESTKKKLRGDRRFVVPAKRTDPLQLRDEQIDPADAMVADVIEARDLKAKARAVEVILKDLGAFADAAEQLRPVLDDLNDTIGKSARIHPAQCVELILAREALVAAAPGLREEAGLRMSDVVAQHRRNLADLLSGMSVGAQRRLVAEIPAAFPENWLDEAFSLLGQAGPRSIPELARVVFDRGEGERLVSFLKAGIQQRSLSPDLLVWICRERRGSASDIFSSDLAAGLLHSLERDHYDEDTPRSNRLHDLLLNDRELLPELVRLCDLSQVRHFTRHLLMSPVFDELNKRSLLARIVKEVPEAADLVTGDDKAKDDGASKLIVSWDSLEKRKKEYEKLVNVDIPENRKEIQIARSYGDLRENFEYKAAKQMQAVLMRRKSEMEAELGKARGTDFSEADPSIVSVGTRVELEDVSSGEKHAYTILGAWDTDLSRDIISYLSGIAESLMGRPVGEVVDLPAAEGEAARRVRIARIEKYSAA